MIKTSNMSLTKALLSYSTTEAAGKNTTGPVQTADMDRANFITTSIGGGLSIIGVLFIVVSYFKLVKFRAGGTTAQTILLYISSGMVLLCVCFLWLPKGLCMGFSCKRLGYILIQKSVCYLSVFDQTIHDPPSLFLAFSLYSRPNLFQLSLWG